MGRRDRKERIIVTGIAGNFGRRLVRRLHREAEVIGLDRRPVHDLPKDVVTHQIDLRRRRAEDIFRTSGADAVVHLNIVHDPRASFDELHAFNIGGTSKLIDYCHRFDIPKLVVVSSSNVYGPAPGNNQFFTEQSPLMAGAGASELRSLVELDMLTSTFFWRYPSIETVLLRPVHILGGVHNGPSNYLRLNRPITVLGFDPMVQIIHVEDVVTAVTLGLTPGVKGIYNIVGPGEVPVSVVLRELGRPRWALPSVVAEPLVRAMWRARLSSFPPPELDFLRYVCMADGSRARQELGFSPAHDLHATIRAVRDARV